MGNQGGGGYFGGPQGYGYPPQPPPQKSVFSGVLLALIVFFIVLPVGGLVTCVVCAGVAHEHAKDTQVGAVKPAAVAVTEAPLPAPPPEVSRIISQALFSRDQELVGCIDTDAPAKWDAGPWTKEERERTLAALRSKDAGSAMPGGSTVLLENDDCDGSFGDRLQLASCSSNGGAFVIHYYSFALLENDIEMRDCLSSHGDWTAMRHDSEEYRRAKSRYDLEKLQKRLGR